MPMKEGTGFGTVYYNKQRNRFSAQYMEYNPENDKYEKKTKSFKTEEEAQKFLSTIMYQRGNPLYIESKGIPLTQFMRAVLKK